MILQEQCECWSCPCCKVLYCCRETILVLEEYWEFATWLLVSFFRNLCMFGLFIFCNFLLLCLRNILSFWGVSTILPLGHLIAFFLFFFLVYYSSLWLSRHVKSTCNLVKSFFFFNILVYYFSFHLSRHIKSTCNLRGFLLLCNNWDSAEQGVSNFVANLVAVMAACF